MSNVGSDFSPMSNAAVSFSNSDGFFSFSSFSQELHEFLVALGTSISKPGFLKRTFSSQNRLGASGAIDHSKHQMWFDGRIKWKKTKLSQNSLLTRNAASFEPINYPKKDTASNYDTDMNQLLLKLFLKAESLIREFLRECISKKVGDLDIRNVQFENKRNKHNLIGIITRRLQTCVDLVGGFIKELEALGVSNSQTMTSYDTRFVELSNTISSLDAFLYPLRTLDMVSKNFLALPSADYLFEYYCFALSIRALEEIGFNIVDIGDDIPIPFFIRLFRKNDGAKVTIFFDQTIPKTGRDFYFHPLIDKKRTASFKRPDFIVHIQKSDFDTTFIMDAKYKTLKKTMRDNFGTKLNSDHLVAKYTSGISQGGSLGIPPFFILAICLADDRDGETIFKSSLHESIEAFSNSSPLIQSGALGVGYESYQPIGSFFSKAIDFHSKLQPFVQNQDTVATVFPRPMKETLHQPNSVERRSFTDSASSWSHKAPSLNEVDAAEVKGMLMRGDKPQDVAFYFGVNNGRISEIKNDSAFSLVDAKVDNLPPAGPYPSIRDFLLKAEGTS